MGSARPCAHVLIVEDDPVMLAEARDAAAVLGDVTMQCARDKAEAERLIARRAFDLAIVDLGLPDGSGVSLIRELSRKHSALICVAWTVFDDDERLFGALAAGAQGYLLKGETGTSLRAKIVAAAAGEPVISPSIARKVLSYFRTHAAVAPRESVEAAPAAPASPLSPRETDVLALVGKGMTIAEAAQALQLSENTVKTHVKAAYGKLNINSRAGAALQAQRLGLL